ncbi:type II toxin-antitoxin system VapC family toxin [Aquidulcibacter sp.]|uniref:type II toxin-antitoxin system VapC family toxin n=1 Tax=Aquidulcibacter sp. TaxID=2052990 RepID=UPI0028A9EFA2|nr:type II toxin-antitoxin system VapC family toxin [Aquidulcibacter sp.]
MIVLDTNVVSELMRSDPDANVAKWFARLAGDSLATTVISVAEITFGFARLPHGERRKRLEDGFLALTHPDGPLPVLAVQSEDAHLYGILRANRELVGRPVTLADALIAAITLRKNARLATRNTRDFDALDIALIDPWQEIDTRSVE